MAAKNKPPVRFEDHLKKSPAKGSNQSPVSIKARELDTNFMWAGLVVDDQPNESLTRPLLTIEEQVVDGYKQRVLKTTNIVGVPTFGIIGGASVTFNMLSDDDPQAI